MRWSFVFQEPDAPSAFGMAALFMDRNAGETMRKNRWMTGAWLTFVASMAATAGPLDYTPSQWAQIDVLRRSASEHANAKAGEACGWSPAEPDTPIDMVALDAAPVSQPALREKLMAMLKEDQASRDVMSAAESPISKARVGYGDARHRKELIAIVDEYGLPTTAMVGDSGVWATFYLSVHADEDLALQRRLLDLMEKAAGASAIPAYFPGMFTTIRRNVPMGKPYAEIYEGDQKGREEAGAEPLIPGDPKSCFASRRRTFAREWLRDHLPVDIAGVLPDAGEGTGEAL